MKPLQGLRVVAWGAMAGRPLARYLESLGATVIVAQPQLQSLSGVDFLIDDLGLACLQDLGLSRAQIEAQFPQLVHVSVTAFGSFGPRARWRGGARTRSKYGRTARRFFRCAPNWEKY